MWIVRLALRRPYTFTVMAILIFLMGGITYLRTAKDIFPTINIPVVSVIWSYNGVAPEEMEKRFVTVTERAMTTTVNDIEHIESQSYTGVSVIKVFFHEGAKVEEGVAQVTSICQTLLRTMPPGTTPPLIIQYSASNVPILQLGLSSKTLSEADLFDQGLNFIRTPLAEVQGAQVPLPFGGKSKQVMVDIDLQKLYAKSLSPADVSAALSAQNIILPAGTIKLGDREYAVRTNSSPQLIDTLNDLPIKQVNGAMVYIRDVANVHDGYAPQTNVVLQNRVRAALLTVLKSANASTLDIVNKVKNKLPQIQSTLPPELDLKQFFDQSIFVNASINGVLREGAIAACLTALMILLFLGSWRSTFVVIISIPLSILCSIIVMAALGQTLNIMTLGGLALAVGILVDDATVEIENIHRNLSMGKQMTRAILDGAQQIAVPAFVATLCICIVFVPIFFLSGVARFLFQPLAMAVIFAMLASYLLSRTVVPTFAKFFLRHHEHEGEGRHTGFFGGIHDRFNDAFERLRDFYTAWLRRALDNSWVIFLAMGSLTVVSLAAWYFFLGKDFFPAVDAGQIRLHVRAPAGTRIEATTDRFIQVGTAIRKIIPADEIENVLMNIGLPTSGINLAFSDSATISSADGEILISLNEKKHGPVAKYMQQMRIELHKQFPDMVFYFASPDIVSQVLNFGIPAPIDVQIVGRDPANYDVAQKIAKEMSTIPGAVDVRVHQVVNGPELRINVDRTRAEQIGLTQQAVASTMLVSLSSSGQAAPNFWLNFKTGVNYTVAVQTPQYNMDTMQELKNTPIAASGTAQTQLLGNLAAIERRESPVIVNHYDVLPVFDVLAAVQNRDLGGVARDVQKVLDKYNPPTPWQRTLAESVGMGGLLDSHGWFKKQPSNLPRGTSISVRGQVQSMNQSFTGLFSGIAFAIILVYFLMVINFQSWTDPFIIIMALPGALCGIIWMLLITGTTISVPSLMGAIMAIGVATSNSILLVTFANDERKEGKNAYEAALSAGYTRLRPIVMTALAMIIGMLPMSLGLGEGGEQNAPLGRAVIGGLIFATFATLFFVPVVYSILRRKEIGEDADEKFRRDAGETEPELAIAKS